MNDRRIEAGVPIVLWLCAAGMVHFFSYGTVEKVAQVGLDRMELRGFAQSVRSTLSPERTLEVAFLDANGNEIPPEVSPAVPPPPAPLPPTKQHVSESKPPEKQPDKKPEEAKKAPPEPPKPAPTEKVQPAPPPPEPEKRVAIKQHSEPEEKDNPAARFAADQARTVKEETQAKLTNHEKDEKDPTPGGQHTSASKEPGNEDKTKIAESDDKAGEKKKAPGEASPSDKSAERSAAAKVDAPKEDTKQPASTKPGEAGVAGARAPAAPAAPAPLPIQGAVAQSPEAITAPKGWSLDPRKSANPTDTPEGASSATALAPTSTSRPAPYSIPKIGAGSGPNGINFSLTPGGALAAVGEKTIEHLREADGERRRSAHRGSWHPPSLDKWRAAIENYVASVKQGNQTALNAARVPFASYLNTIHNKLHPIFADAFLDSLETLPANHQLNGVTLRTDLEVVVDKDSGKIVKMGVVRTSGVTAFDVAALEAMERASPFGKADPSIVSGDGRVYLHWEFHRQREIACGTVNARPFKLKGEPETPAPTLPPLRGPRVPDDPKEGRYPG